MGLKFDNVTGRVTDDDAQITPVITFDVSLPAERNNYITLATAIAAVQLIRGDRILRIVSVGTHVWPVGTYDCFQLHILADRSLEFSGIVRIQFPEGVVFSRVPKAIRGFDRIEFTNTATPIYSGNGQDFDLELETNVPGGGRIQTTSTGIAFIINDTVNARYCRLAIYGSTHLLKNGGAAAAVLRLENLATLVLELYDQARVDSSLSAYPFTDDGLGNNYCELRVIGTGATFACPTLVEGFGTITSIYLGMSGRDGVVSVDPQLLGRLATNLGNTSLIPEVPTPYSGVLMNTLVNSGNSKSYALLHPIIPFMAMHGRGSVMPSGINGNALVADGILAGGLTASAIVTALNVGTNIRRIEAQTTTGVLVGDEAGWQSTDTVAARGLLSRITIGFRVAQTTSVRFFMGVSDRAVRADNTAADNPAGANMVGLQFSTDRGDTKVQFMTQAAGAQTRQTCELNGALSASFSYVLEIVFSNKTNAASIGVWMRLFRHASSTGTELGSHSFTVAQCPAANVQLRVVSSVQTRIADNPRTLITHAANLSSGT